MAQLGRALRSGRRSRKFESCHLDHFGSEKRFSEPFSLSTAPHFLRADRLLRSALCAFMRFSFLPFRLQSPLFSAIISASSFSPFTTSSLRLHLHFSPFTITYYTLFVYPQKEGITSYHALRIYNPAVEGNTLR